MNKTDLEFEQTKLDRDMEHYKGLDDLDLLYKYSRVSYLYERAVEHMLPYEEIGRDMLLMRTVLLDRMSRIRMLRTKDSVDSSRAKTEPKRELAKEVELTEEQLEPLKNITDLL